ncbi:hypothetical protein NL676_029473 [Syzygium grande]|nr:hypothetical protein NL676_029473 [Syzygium grande]
MTHLRFTVKNVASSNEWSAAREFGCFATSLVRLPTLRRNWSFGEVLLTWSQRRFMTTSKRVQDRSKNKRVHDLEITTEKHKVLSKVLVLMEMLKKEPEMIIPVRLLDRHRRQINLPKPHSIVDFIRKSSKLFELYKDQKGVLWCGMTKEAEDLLEEEERLIREHSGTAAKYVTRMLMMSVDKRLPLDKIAHFRREFGLPVDFRSKWVHGYPQHFKVVESLDEVDYLELVEWNPAWAITELEKAVLGVSESAFHTPGLLSLSFPLKFPASYNKIYRYRGSIEHFQKRSYLSPYADARGLQAGSKEFDKRAIAVMHELLSFTMEKSSEDEGIPMQLDQEEAISELEYIAVGDSSFMDIYEIDNEYKPHDSF